MMFYYYNLPTLIIFKYWWMYLWIESESTIKIILNGSIVSE